MECCFWILAVYYEPQFSQARKMMTKLIAMLSIIDDTYDAYGTIDELELFSKAIERFINTNIYFHRSSHFLFLNKKNIFLESL